MAQYGLPISDASKGTDTAECAGDGNANCWEELDDGFGAGRGSGSGPDDATTNWRSVTAIDRAGTHLRCVITSLTDPQSSSGHIARSRVVKTNACTASSSGKQFDMTVVLVEGTTDRATATTTNILGTWTTITLTLSSGEADSITDYTNLRVEHYGIGVGGGAARSANCSALEFECPDAAPSVTPLSATPADNVSGVLADIFSGQFRFRAAPSENLET